VRRSPLATWKGVIIGWPVGQAIVTLIPRERKWGGRGSVVGDSTTSVWP
jgi:hypothetical protein